MPISSQPDEVARAIGERDRVAVEQFKRLEQAAHRDDKDRSFIARAVVLGFGASVLAIVALMFAGAIFGGGEPWRQAMTAAVDLVKSALLPVVTLILGYYFGRAAKG